MPGSRYIPWRCLKRLFLLCSVLALLLGMAGPLVGTAFAQPSAGSHALVISVDGVINPVKKRFIERAIGEALEGGAVHSHHPVGHPRRAVDVHQGHRGAAAGLARTHGGLRVSERSAGRFRRHLHHRRRQFRCDGPRLQHRRSHPSLRHWPRPGRNPGQQGGKRRGRPHPQHRPGTRAQRRAAGGHGARSRVIQRPRGRGRQGGGFPCRRHRWPFGAN